MSKDRVLGKGLSALIQGADLRGGPVPAADTDTVRRLDLEAIGFNPDQPRKTFYDNSLEELAASIKQVGVLQPVLVRRLERGERAVQHGGVHNLRWCPQLDEESAEQGGHADEVQDQDQITRELHGRTVAAD